MAYLYATSGCSLFIACLFGFIWIQHNTINHKTLKCVINSFFMFGSFNTFSKETILVNMTHLQEVKNLLISKDF